MKKEQPNVHEQLSKYVPQKPGKFVYALQNLLLKIINKKSHVQYVYHFSPSDYKTKQVMCLADHASRDNYYFVTGGLPQIRFNTVMGYYNVLNKTLFKLFLKCGVILKRLYIPDAVCTRQMARLYRQGANMMLFPEGIQSTGGNAHPIHPSTVKMLKAFPQDVILAKTFGAYLTRPRFSKQYRYGKITVDYQVLFTKEDILTLTEQQIYQKLVSAFAYNDFSYNAVARIPYYGKEPNATGLNHILYRCQNCQSEFAMTVEDDTLVCTHCGQRVIVNAYYDLSCENGTLKYDRIDTWFNEQRRLVEEETLSENFEMTMPVVQKSLSPILKKEKFIAVSQGILTVNHSGLSYVSQDGAVTLNVPIAEMPSLILFPGEGVALYYQKDVYRFDMTQNPEVSAKLVLAVEALHNQIDTLWANATKDAYPVSIS